MNREIIEITEENAKEVFKRLYEGSAMTIQGMLMEELNKYTDLIKERCGLHEKYTVYHFVGKVYNDTYNLTGTNRLPDDLNCISIELKDMDNCMGVRQLIRWFDDIVDNDLRRELEK